MKIILTTTMALAVVTVLGATQPAEAAVIQPGATVYHNDHVTPVWWRGHHRGGWRWHHHHHPYYWHHPYRYWRWGW